MQFVDMFTMFLHTKFYKPNSKTIMYHQLNIVFALRPCYYFISRKMVIIKVAFRRFIGLYCTKFHSAALNRGIREVILL